jgi:hypothetical protein
MPFAPNARIVTPIIAMLIVTSVSCRRDKTNAGAAIEVQEESPAVPRGPIDPAFTEQIHSTAIGYFDYPRVDDKPHWAPGPCANTKLVEDAPHIRLSSAAPNSLHGEKLYYLYVKNHESYLKPADSSAPIGQVIVKQAYLAYEIKKPDEVKPSNTAVVERSGRKYTTGEPLALFIMMKLDEKTPNTDHGWIYGITDFNGDVKSAGVIEACASCHAHAAHDRLFGPIHE